MQESSILLPSKNLISEFLFPFLGQEFMFNYVQEYLDLVVSKNAYSCVLTHFSF